MTHNEDFIETFREVVYPPLHNVLTLVGFYATGELSEAEHVGTVEDSEEELEKVFHDTGVVRNALAKYKSLPDGRESEGSWRLTHHTHPHLVEPKMQLHITFFAPTDGDVSEAVEVYAHYEMNYGASILGHLNGRHYSAEEGVKRARQFFRNRTGYEL